MNAMSITDWSSALDWLDEQINRQYELFAAGEYDSVEAIELPDTLGPLPQELKQRADELLKRSYRLEEAGAELLAEAARQLSAQQQAPRSNTPTRSSVTFTA